MIQQNSNSTPDNKVPLSSIFAEFKTRLLRPSNVIPCTLSPTLFAIVGPYGNFETDTFVSRFVVWLAVVWTTSCIAIFLGVWASARYQSQPFWFHSTTGGVVFSVIFLLLAWIALRAVFPPSSNPSPLYFFLFTVGVCTLSYVVIWYFSFMVESWVKKQYNWDAQTPVVEASPEPEKTEDAPAQSTGINSFLEKLEAGPNARLIRLAMSDHYIEAHTNTGMHLVYMRFSDAIDTLSSANGVQVHRSHWVNIDEIETSRKEGAKAFLVMSDGTSVPISRSRKKEISDMGLI